MALDRHGDPGGPPVVLLHGFPYDPRCYDAVVPRLVEAGHTFEVPFHFVVPGQLTLGACSHTVVNDAVRDYHTQPPPTMGSWDNSLRKLTKSENFLNLPLFEDFDKSFSE